MVVALDQRLAHMRDVEQSSKFAGVEMLGEDARRIVDRHVVAGERRHARAELDVQGVQRRFLIRGFAHGPPVVNKRPPQRQAAGLRLWSSRTPPLSHDLRDFPLAAVAPVGGRTPLTTRASFQSVITRAVPLA